MSQENVEIVRRVIDAFNQRDLDAAGRYNDSSVEVDWSRSRGVEAGVYRGRAEVRGFWDAFLEVFDRVTIFPDEFLERGDHVVVPNRTDFYGRDGVKVQAHSVMVVTLHDGLVVEWRLYQERAEALEAVGLSEQDAHADS